jgi:hypothetical protein
MSNNKRKGRLKDNNQSGSVSKQQDANLSQGNRGNVSNQQKQQDYDNSRDAWQTGSDGLAE